MSNSPILNSDYYEVEKIIDFRIWRHKKYYLVKWKGYSEQDNTWEPLSNLKNVFSLVSEFHKDKKKQTVKHERSPLKEISKKRETISSQSSDENEEENENEKEVKSEEENEDIKTYNEDQKQSKSIEEVSEKQQFNNNIQQELDTIQPSIQREENLNYPLLFSRLKNTLPVEQNNNQKIKLLRSQVPLDYLISFYQQTQGINVENYQYENEDSQYPAENFLQKPIVQALLRQIIQFTDQDSQEIAFDHYERTRNRFLGMMQRFE